MTQTMGWRPAPALHMLVDRLRPPNDQCRDSGSGVRVCQLLRRPHQSTEASGRQEDSARIEVFDAYLDGRPADRGRKKLTWKDRDELFGSSQVVRECPADGWPQEAMVLALAR